MIKYGNLKGITKQSWVIISNECVFRLLILSLVHRQAVEYNYGDVFNITVTLLNRIVLEDKKRERGMDKEELYLWNPGIKDVCKEDISSNALIISK